MKFELNEMLVRNFLSYTDKCRADLVDDVKPFVSAIRAQLPPEQPKVGELWQQEGGSPVTIADVYGGTVAFHYRYEGMAKAHNVFVSDFVQHYKRIAL